MSLKRKITQILAIFGWEKNLDNVGMINNIAFADRWSNPHLNVELGKMAPDTDNLMAGLIAYADGTNWNPNSQGVGFYYYNGSAWVKLLAGVPLGVTEGGTGTVTQFTAGSIVFAGASGVYTQDNTNLFFDDTNNIFKALNAYLGGSTTNLQVDSNGDAYFVGAGTGLPFGSCWGNEIAQSQAAAVQNTWYAINDTDMTDGQLNLVTHDGAGKLTVSKAGKYLINYAVSMECSAAGHVQTGILVDGSAQNDGIQHEEVSASKLSEQFNIGSTAIISLAANNYVQIAFRTTDAGGPTLIVDHLNLTIVQVGA